MWLTLRPTPPQSSTVQINTEEDYNSELNTEDSEEDYNSEHDDYNLSLPPLQDEYAVMQVNIYIYNICVCVIIN